MILNHKNNDQSGIGVFSNYNVKLLSCHQMDQYLLQTHQHLGWSNCLVMMHCPLPHHPSIASLSECLLAILSCKSKKYGCFASLICCIIQYDSIPMEIGYLRQNFESKLKTLNHMTYTRI